MLTSNISRFVGGADLTNAPEVLEKLGKRAAAIRNMDYTVEGANLAKRFISEKTGIGAPIVNRFFDRDLYSAAPLNLPSQMYQKISDPEIRTAILGNLKGQTNIVAPTVKAIQATEQLLKTAKRVSSIFDVNDDQERLIAATGIDPSRLYQFNKFTNEKLRNLEEGIQAASGFISKVNEREPTHTVEQAISIINSDDHANRISNDQLQFITPEEQINTTSLPTPEELAMMQQNPQLYSEYLNKMENDTTQMIQPYTPQQEARLNALTTGTYGRFVDNSGQSVTGEGVTQGNEGILVPQSMTVAAPFVFDLPEPMYRGGPNLDEYNQQHAQWQLARNNALQVYQAQQLQQGKNNRSRFVQQATDLARKVTTVPKSVQKFGGVFTKVAEVSKNIMGKKVDDLFEEAIEAQFPILKDVFVPGWRENKVLAEMDPNSAQKYATKTRILNLSDSVKKWIPTAGAALAGTATLAALHPSIGGGMSLLKTVLAPALTMAADETNQIIDQTYDDPELRMNPEDYEKYYNDRVSAYTGKIMDGAGQLIKDSKRPFTKTTSLVGGQDTANQTIPDVTTAGAGEQRHAHMDNMTKTEGGAFSEIKAMMQGLVETIQNKNKGAAENVHLPQNKDEIQMMINDAYKRGREIAEMGHQKEEGKSVFGILGNAMKSAFERNVNRAFGLDDPTTNQTVAASNEKKENQPPGRTWGDTLSSAFNFVKSGYETVTGVAAEREAERQKTENSTKINYPAIDRLSWDLTLQGQDLVDVGKIIIGGMDDQKSSEYKEAFARWNALYPAFVDKMKNFESVKHKFGDKLIKNNKSIKHETNLKVFDNSINKLHEYILRYGDEAGNIESNSGVNRNAARFSNWMVSWVGAGPQLGKEGYRDDMYSQLALAQNEISRLDDVFDQVELAYPGSMVAAMQGQVPTMIPDQDYIKKWGLKVNDNLVQEEHMP